MWACGHLGKRTLINEVFFLGREFAINPDLLRAFPDVARTVLGYQSSFDAAKISGAVQKISDFYISRPSGKTPYELPGAPAAYLLYYTLLNHVRCLGVFREAQNLGFFANLDRVIDWGSGMGAAWLALRDVAPGSLGRSLAIDRSPKALEIQMALRRAFVPGDDAGCHAMATDDRKIHDFLGSAKAESSKTLAVFSYSLTEIETLPDWVHRCEALAIIEPGTNQDGRRLLGVRDSLIQKGYQVWAPCTHQGPCPLLTQSKTDWCHDRVMWQQPEFYQDIEKHLPMKHRTLVFSYLLARKTLAPPADLVGAARLTGDQQRLKGQTRQMVCRSSEREFLSWQHRHGEPPEFLRGELVEVSGAAQKKGADIRVTSDEIRRFSKKQN